MTTPDSLSVNRRIYELKPYGDGMGNSWVDFEIRGWEPAQDGWTMTDDILVQCRLPTESAKVLRTMLDRAITRSSFLANLATKPEDV